MDTDEIKRILYAMNEEITFVTGLSVGIVMCRENLDMNIYTIRMVIGDSMRTSVREAYHLLRDHLNALLEQQESQKQLPLENHSKPDSPCHNQ